MIDELRVLIYAGIGEWVVRTAAILLALSAIVTVIGKAVRRSFHMGRDIGQLVDFARTGDQRIERIEDQMAEMQAAITRMADELARVPELAESVVNLTEAVGQEIERSIARDEELVTRLEQIAPVTPPHGNPTIE